MVGRVQEGGDALVRLNDAFFPDAVLLDVPAGVVRAGAHPHRPLVRPGRARRPPARPPSRVPRCGWATSAQASVVEVYAGPPGATRSLVVPVTELDGRRRGVALLRVVADPQRRGLVAGPPGRAGRAGLHLRTFTVGLGGDYDRVRADVAVEGRGAHSEILSAYLGNGTQVHDIRTLQDHVAPRTTSELLCQGAVAGTSRSVYSGLIRVHRGAVRTDARQTNHNLVLDEGAHADSVPNLDILENDVKCSHASTVGPIDEDQRYYIESRGDRARRGRGAHRPGFLRRHHRPRAHPGGDAAAAARGARAPRRCLRATPAPMPEAARA